MIRPLTAGQSPIKIGDEWMPKGKGPHDDIEVRVAYGLFQTPDLVGDLASVDLQEMRLSVNRGEWRLLLKGVRRKRYVIAYFYAPTWREVLTEMVTMADTGYIPWQDDEVPLPSFEAP